MKKKWYNYFVVSEGQPAEPDAPPVIESPPRRVTEVVPDVESDASFTAPVSDPTAFDEIYRSAQIPTPPHGYSVLKVAEMLQSEHIRSLPADVKRKSIMVALDAAGVKVDDIVGDAVQRDRALDTYERVLQKQLDALRSEKEAENRRLEAEVNERLKELRSRIEANNKEIGREQDQLVAWRTQKREEESKIAEAVGYFVSENPITTSNPSGNEKGGSQHVR
jgi:Asp-tRNA(Asn)/Glu-tRNA(Gln) amidotransferase A subunit family amidase